MENTDFKDGETLGSYSTSDRIGIHHIETKKKKKSIQEETGREEWN